ncbi:MAG: hypothetical protein M0Z57_07625 [Deltaproteobacteria bacterium]|jgi:hypothetical protein|uniref:Uncharacterized protein n=1 Tax=Candidatus Acidulodesulfobacterium acidiphilum TaxID=2597224 RepID=A0A520XD03_9DELT|nr:hypothetical protein [Deltaproteobacteria bacterium]RZV39012.1 MAG: hypothetical protein EVJ48_05865 [Candidatus Acidulodesulfobacterium acidiphilum]
MIKVNYSFADKEERGDGKDAEGFRKNRTTYRNLFERIKPDEKEKIMEKIDKKEIRKYIEEKNFKNIESDGK